MKRLLSLTVVTLFTTAHAQLQVTTAPQQACAEEMTPILGIAMQSYLSGDYGIPLTNNLKKALEAKGFQVVPDYSYKLIDLATIGIKGEVNHWKNIHKEESKRVGNVHLTIYDLNTGKNLLNLDQKAAPIVMSAPQPDAFIQNVVNVIAQKFCQQQ